jgi:hypothetical protein
MDLFEEDPPIDPHTRAIGISVYKDTWNEFYTWEQDECRRALNSLAISEPPQDPRSLYGADNNDPNLDFDFEAFDSESELHSDTITETFTQEEFDANENSIRYSTLTCFTQKATQMKGYPLYEVCTPASRNHARDPFYEQDQVLFVPYADDPAFPVEIYLEMYYDFSWQVDFADPDRK